MMWPEYWMYRNLNIVLQACATYVACNLRCETFVFHRIVVLCSLLPCRSNNRAVNYVIELVDSSVWETKYSNGSGRSICVLCLFLRTSQREFPFVCMYVFVTTSNSNT